MPRKITPPPALAAVIANHAARAAGDGRAHDAAQDAPLPADEDVTAYGLELGRAYVINADGTLSPTVQPAGRDTTATRGRLTR